MARVAAYIRRSTPGEDDKNYSLESQLEDITTWARNEGHEMVATFSDPGGESDTLDRPALNQLFETARSRAFDVVAVWRFDRFSRDEEQAVIAVHMLRQNDVRVISITQPIPDGPLGTLMMSMHNFASKLELLGIRERVNRGKMQRVRSGKLPPISRPKYGYQFDDSKKERYVLHPETSPIVERIFADYIAGKPLRTIARELTDENVLTPGQILLRDGWSLPRSSSVGIWRTATIFNILTDPAYKGRMIGYRSKYVKVQVAHPLTGEMRTVKRKIARDTGDAARYEYGPDVCPPIVSEEMFEAVQERMAINKERSSRNTKHPSNLLLRAGLARCGWCGYTMMPEWSKADNQHRYICTRKWKHLDECPAPTRFSIRASELDDYAWNWFTGKLSDPDAIAAAFTSYLNDASKLKTKLTGQLQASRTALTEAQSEEEEYVKAVGRAGSDAMRDKFIAMAEAAHERAVKLERDIEKLEHELSHERRDEELMRALQDSAPKALKRLQSADIQDRREAMYYCKVQVTVWGRGHDPSYEASWLQDYVHSHLLKWTQFIASAA